jgi:cellulose biosynthesis protein BcsQ
LSDLRLSPLSDLEIRGVREASIFLPPVSQRIAVAEAVANGLTVAEYAPDSPAHEEFRELARQVDKLLRK